MIEVTEQELAEFVREKGDSPINFSQIDSNCDCGCLFIQYGKKVFPDKFLHATLRELYLIDQESHKLTILMRFPIRYDDWCPPMNGWPNSKNTEITEFSQLIIPEGL